MSITSCSGTFRHTRNFWGSVGRLKPAVQDRRGPVARRFSMWLSEIQRPGLTFRTSRPYGGCRSAVPHADIRHCGLRLCLLRRAVAQVQLSDPAAFDCRGLLGDFAFRRFLGCGRAGGRVHAVCGLHRSRRQLASGGVRWLHPRRPAAVLGCPGLLQRRPPPPFRSAVYHLLLPPSPLPDIPGRSPPLDGPRSAGRPGPPDGHVRRGDLPGGARGARTLGVGSGIFMLLCLFMFYRRYIGTTLTEHLGITFGCLAFCLIWRGAVAARLGPVLVGLFFLSLGLNARAGAFLILPAIACWAAWDLRGPSRPYCGSWAVPPPPSCWVSRSTVSF